MSESSIKAIISGIVISIILFLIRKARKSVTEDMLKNLEIHDTLKSTGTIWESHPMKKYYFCLRIIFYSGLFIFGASKLYWIYTGNVELNFHLPVLGLTCLLFFLLLIVKCPKCKTSLFLQEMNTFTLKAPQSCIHCGHPASLPEKTEKHVAIRPAFKWAFIIFMVIPICGIIIALIYASIKGTL